MSNPDDPQSWITKADSDLLNIRNNLAAERVPWDTVCFHAQQAAEKMLKAFLVSLGLTAPRTHDLIVLLAEMVEEEASMAAWEGDCRLLTPYAVMLRYPGACDAVSEGEARQAAAAAQRISEGVRAAIE
jgi:HEPN domain-containing protein